MALFPQCVFTAVSIHIEDDEGELFAGSRTLLRQRREEAFARIEELRKEMQPLGMSTQEWIRRDRDSHE